MDKLNRKFDKTFCPMTKLELIEKLVTEYGAIIRTQYHIQIPTTNGQHSIWFTKDGSIRCLFYGDTESTFLSKKILLDKLSRYKYEQTDLAFMLQLAKFVTKIEGREGIFVDAGWKDGEAKIAIVRSQVSGDMNIFVRCIEAPHSAHAENLAIAMAIEMFPTDEIIYSDCLSATIKYPDRVQWISRKQNREADTFGNMRQAGGIKLKSFTALEK